MEKCELILTKLRFYYLSMIFYLLKLTDVQLLVVIFILNFEKLEKLVCISFFEYINVLHSTKGKLA